MKRAAVIIVALVFLAYVVPVVVASRMGGAPQDWREALEPDGV